jgi:hypothetical protein
MNTVEFVDGSAPGISAALLNEPFHLKRASYDGGIITVTIGPGRANFGGGVSGIIEKLSDSTLTISTPVPKTTYYIFIQYDGSFFYSSSSLETTGVLIGSVATGEQVNVLTRDDLRGILPGPIDLRGGTAQTFTSAGIFTVPPGVTTVYVTMCGGGGGGGAADGLNNGAPGGNAAIVFMRAVQVTPGQSITITIGAGGSGGKSGYGTSGGTTSFGPYVSCIGGAGGAGGTSASNGASTTNYSPHGFFEFRGCGGSYGNPLAQRGEKGTDGICIVQW